MATSLSRGPGRVWRHLSSQQPARSLHEDFTRTAETQPRRAAKEQHGTKRWLHYDKPTPNSVRERNIAVTSYYNQQTIDLAAEKPSVRLTPATIMYASITADKKHDALRSAQYLHKELPIRVAHRIASFRNLPFIVGCNPTILAVHELYIRAFHILNDFPEILSNEDVVKYDLVLKTLLEDHKDVIGSLAQGFKECRKHVAQDSTISSFLDRTLTSRLGIRMLVTHHLLLQESKPGYIGLINLGMGLRDKCQHWSNFVRELAEDRYGHCPPIKISGHTGAHFPYIEMPLDYILPELLKNAVRATIETNTGVKGDKLPTIHIVLASNKEDFIIKISDRGGGIPHDTVDRVLDYNFTTAEQSTDQLMENSGIFGNMMEAINRTTSGPMHGYGFGLSMSKAYAEYLGGCIQVLSMQGLGTDVLLRLKHLESKHHELRI